MKEADKLTLSLYHVVNLVKRLLRSKLLASI